MTRECGTCTLCCKVMGIYALEKPQGVWCPHCAPGRGCEIYETRPQECRTFACNWLVDEGLGEEWKPDKCRMVLVPNEIEKRYVVHVDPAMPDAWKKAPYRQRLMTLMQAGLPLGRLVFIDVAGKLSLLLPDRVEELGRLRPGDKVALQTLKLPQGPQYRVTVTRGS